MIGGENNITTVLACYYGPVETTYKMKNKKYHTFGTVPKSKRKITETGNIDIPSTQIHNDPLSWLDTGTSIKCGGMELALWVQ